MTLNRWGHWRQQPFVWLGSKCSRYPPWIYPVSLWNLISRLIVSRILRSSRNFLQLQSSQLAFPSCFHDYLRHCKNLQLCGLHRIPARTKNHELVDCWRSFSVGKVELWTQTCRRHFERRTLQQRLTENAKNRKTLSYHVCQHSSPQQLNQLEWRAKRQVARNGS